jgi:hypothetical protein
VVFKYVGFPIETQSIGIIKKFRHPLDHPSVVGSLNHNGNFSTCADKSAPTVVPTAQHGRNDDQGLINQTVFKVKR